MPEPQFTALLFGLTGCLVDHGARTLPIALQHSGLTNPRDPGLLSALLASAAERAEALPGVGELLQRLHNQRLAHAWLDELPAEVTRQLSSALPQTIPAATPAPRAPGRRRMPSGRR